jgi:lantibiotic modifying enzyme
VPWGTEWNYICDITAGAAGVATYFLFLHEVFNYPLALAWACSIGRRLLQLARPIGEDMCEWLFTPDLEHTLPNFSHGTAGIVLVLCSIYQLTGEACVLEAARKGGEFLKREAKVGPHDSCLIAHSRNDPDLYYLGRMT